ncbi:MAG: FlgO family outer membrane protein [Desulfurivibrionaceae bacterium]
MNLIKVKNLPGILSVLLISVALLISCSTLEEEPRLGRNNENFFGFSKIIADELLASGTGDLNKNGPIILTSFVNLNDLYQTSGFGRSMTEALSTELFQQGYKTLEIRKTPKIYVKNGKGELSLSRDASLLARQHNARAILTGTYSLTPTTVILNVKILSAFSRDVLSAAALEIKRTDNIDYLLTKNRETTIGQMSAYER